MARAATATARIATRSTWLDAHGAAEDVANGAVRALPHLLQVEFLYTGLVGGDRRAFNADLVLEDRLSRLNRHFIVRL